MFPITLFVRRNGGFFFFFRLISLLLASLILFAGCSPEVQDPAQLTMAKLSSGDIAYGNYRTYIDVTEEMYADQARLYLGQVEMVKKDIESYGIEVDEEDLSAAVESSLEQLRAQQGNDLFMELLTTDTGLTSEDIDNALRVDARMSYLFNEIMAKFEEDGAKEDAEQDALSLLTDYYNQAETRITPAEDPDSTEVICLLDGEPVAMTEEYQNYILYQSVYTRLAVIDELATCIAMQRDLEAKGKEISWDGFEDYKAEYLETLESTEEVTETLDRALLNLEMTREDFYSSLDDLCAGEDISRETLEAKLAAIGYAYDPGRNQFV